MPQLPLPFSNLSPSNWVLKLQQEVDAEERLRALQAIGSLCSPTEVSRWSILALCDPDSTVRALAAKFAGTIGLSVSDEVDSLLLSLLNDPDPDVRFESARALIRRNAQEKESTIPILLKFLDETETQALMVAAVVNALVETDLPPRIADGELRPRIQKLLDHERAEVREAVAIAFAKWPRMAVNLTDRLLPLLEDSEPIVREKIAYTLGRAGVVNDTIKSALESMCQDEDVEVARHAAEALRLLNREVV